MLLLSTFFYTDLGPQRTRPLYFLYLHKNVSSLSSPKLVSDVLRRDMAPHCLQIKTKRQDHLKKKQLRMYITSGWSERNHTRNILEQWFGGIHSRFSVREETINIYLFYLNASINSTRDSPHIGLTQCNTVWFQKKVAGSRGNPTSISPKPVVREKYWHIKQK